MSVFISVLHLLLCGHGRVVLRLEDSRTPCVYRLAMGHGAGGEVVCCPSPKKAYSVPKIVCKRMLETAGQSGAVFAQHPQPAVRPPGSVDRRRIAVGS